MDSKTEIDFDASRYRIREIEPNPTMNSNSSVKYILPRVVGHTLSKNLQSSVFGHGYPGLGASHSTLSTTTTVGMAALSQGSTFTTVSAIHSIDGERIIDELRELSKLTELLGTIILQCCALETHIRAQQLQIEWLNNHQTKNAATVQTMYQNEIDSAKKILQAKYEAKSQLEMKIKDVQETIASNEDQYQQILDRRNNFSKELFDVERQIAQNTAESKFLHRRVNHLDEESKYYIVRNQLLQARKARLRYDLDEDTFTAQALRLELDFLENEKITSEDVHSSALDDAQQTVETSQLPAMQPSKAFYELLSAEVQRIRTEFETKIESYREELHRRFELDLHRYQMQKSYSGNFVTKEHEVKLEMYQKEKQEVMQQMAGIRGKIDETINQIDKVEKDITAEKENQVTLFDRRKELSVLQQMMQEREKQLQEVLRNRANLKEQIEDYKDQLERYPKHIAGKYLKRSSFSEFTQPSSHVTTRVVNTENHGRRSVQELPTYTRPEEGPHSPNESKSDLSETPRAASISSNDEPVRTSFVQVKEFWEEGTLTGTTNFNLKQDCDELHRLLAVVNIDEIAVIRVLCNRNVTQRLQIRDRYRSLFNQNLGDNIEMIPNHSLNKLLRILLLSPVEHDCYELRRILRGANLDETVLVEIIFSRTGKHIRSVKETYQKLFQTTLEQEINNNPEHEPKDMLLTLYRAVRPEDNEISNTAVYRDARKLYESGAQWRSKDSPFLRLLCSRSNGQLKQIFAVYNQFSDVDIEEAIKVHFDGPLYYNYMAIVRLVRNRSRFFAYELKKSIRGAATNEDNVNRIIVSRCEIDMVQVKSEYERIAKRTLYTHIQADVEGNYKVALLELLRQRIDLGSKNSGASPPSNLVHWRKSMNQHTSSATVSRPLERSLSDRHTNRSSYERNGETFGQQRQNQLNDISPVNTRIGKSRIVDQRGFVPMPTMQENVLTSSHYEE